MNGKQEAEEVIEWDVEGRKAISRRCVWWFDRIKKACSARLLALKHEVKSMKELYASHFTEICMTKFTFVIK